MPKIEPPLLVKYTPDETALEKCRQLGKKIAEKLILAHKNLRGGE